tara:strand:+ start:778 stop:945 length:168 start_codon:yes stop_codon:yes gene_type:complete
MMYDYIINGEPSSWEELPKIAKKKNIPNIDRMTIVSLVALLRIKGYSIERIPQDS